MATGKTVLVDPDTELVAHETVAQKNGIDKPEWRCPAVWHHGSGTPALRTLACLRGRARRHPIRLRLWKQSPRRPSFGPKRFVPGPSPRKRDGSEPVHLFLVRGLSPEHAPARNMHSSYSVSSGGQPDTSRPRCSRKPASINLIPSSDLRQRAGHVAAQAGTLVDAYCPESPMKASLFVTGAGFHLPVRTSDLGA